MDRDRVLRVIAHTFGLTEPIEQLKQQVVRQETIEKWDSLGHLNLCMALEREFGVKIPMGKMPKLTTLEEIEACLSELMSE